MASKLKATGLILLIVGVLTLTVFNLAWAAFPPFGGRTQTEFTEQSITGSSNEDVFVAFIPTNAILFLRINVVFDFQGGQSGFFIFISLSPGNPGFSVSGDGDQFIQFRAVTVVDQPAFVEYLGCVFQDGGFDEICQAAQAGQ